MTEQLNQKQQQTVDRLKQYLSENSLNKSFHQPKDQDIDDWNEYYSTNLVFLLEQAFVHKQITSEQNERLKQEVIEVFGPYHHDAVHTAVDELNERLLGGSKFQRLRRVWGEMR